MASAPFMVPAQEPLSTKFRFRHHVIDTGLEGNGFGQTALVDLDGDGRPEFVMGRRGGPLFVYKYQSPEKWTRHGVGQNSPSDVGLAVLDVDRDGRPDLVAGGVWYRNSGDLNQPFERIVFDGGLSAVHDLAAADVNADGRTDILAMSDRHNLRWYQIPNEPRQPWKSHDIGPAVHSGLAVGDLNGDGRLDVVRTDVWFENLRGDGTEWRRNEIGPNTPPPSDFRPPFAFNATRAWIGDLNGDGYKDIVFADNEIPGGKIWWMENTDGMGIRWRRHDVFAGGEPRRGAFHTLQVADFDGDGDVDIFTCEMEHVRGRNSPRWYLWENLDGSGGAWKEHVILDANLGGHEALAEDVTGNGRLDLIGKPWSPHPDNALDGRMFVVFLENIEDNPATADEQAPTPREGPDEDQEFPTQ
jgi:hypothetical protein